VRRFIFEVGRKQKEEAVFDDKTVEEYYPQGCSDLLQAIL
jgi:hypothetical protein